VRSARIRSASWRAARRTNSLRVSPLTAAEPSEEPDARQLFAAALHDFREAIGRHNLRELACSPTLFAHYHALSALISRQTWPVDFYSSVAPGLVIVFALFVSLLCFRRIRMLSARPYARWRRICERIALSVAIVVFLAAGASTLFNALAIHHYRAVYPPHFGHSIMLTAYVPLPARLTFCGLPHCQRWRPPQPVHLSR